MTPEEQLVHAATNNDLYGCTYAIMSGASDINTMMLIGAANNYAHVCHLAYILGRRELTHAIKIAQNNGNFDMATMLTEWHNNNIMFEQNRTNEINRLLDELGF